MDDSVADELYAVGPREFVAARDARARQLKDSGDKEAAAEVKALRRPTVAAWLANQLVRKRADEVTALLDLGAALREATASLSGPELRQLSRQRNQVVQALVRQARRLAADAGQPVADEAGRGLEDTLNAALVDEAAGRALMAGRLTDALRHTGFTPTGGSVGPARHVEIAPAARRPREGRTGEEEQSGESAAERRTAQRRERLERDLAEASAAAREAADARAAADDAAAAARAAVDTAQARVDDLRSRLADAESELRAASAERARSDARQDEAATAAEKATSRVRRLEQDLDAS